MDDMIIQLDTLVVELDPADAAAFLADLGLLGPAIVAALRERGPAAVTWW